jgi:FixJ family two-component response regulator
MKTPLPWIAVIDDDFAIRRALLRLLRSVEIEARAFATGAEFFASLQPCAPDCVLLDLQMPEMSGYEVLARLDAKNLAIPAIVMTGQHTADSHARVMLGDAMCYLLKPVCDQLLLDAIALARRKSAARAATSALPVTAPRPGHGQSTR